MIPDSDLYIINLSFLKFFTLLLQMVSINRVILRSLPKIPFTISNVKYLINKMKIKMKRLRGREKYQYSVPDGTGFHFQSFSNGIL